MDGGTDEEGAGALIDIFQDPNISDKADPHRHVTIRPNRSGVAEITTLLETMYLEEGAEDQLQVSDDGEDMAGLLQELHLKIEALEDRQKQAVDSALNREDGLRAAIEAVAKQVNEHTDERLQKMDQAVVMCLERRENKNVVSQKKLLSGADRERFKRLTA